MTRRELVLVLGGFLASALVLTFPLMTTVQMIAARIGRTTGKGIAGVLRQHYPNWLLQWMVVLLVVANVVNIGADLGAMADRVVQACENLHSTGTALAR